MNEFETLQEQISDIKLELSELRDLMKNRSAEAWSQDLADIDANRELARRVRKLERGKAKA